MTHRSFNSNVRKHQQANCSFTGKGGKGAGSVTPVQQQGEASAGHRVGVRVLALICAQVQILHIFNRADFYLLTPLVFCVTASRPSVCC